MIEFLTTTGSGLLVIFIAYISRIIFWKYKESQLNKSTNNVNKIKPQKNLYKKRSKESYVDSFNKLLVFFCNQANSYYSEDKKNEDPHSYEVDETNASLLKNKKGFDPEWLNLNDQYKLVLNFNYPPNYPPVKSKTESNVYIRFLPSDSVTQTNYLNIFYVFEENKPQLFFTYNDVSRSHDNKDFRKYMEKYGKGTHFDVPKLNDENKEKYYDTFNDLITHSLELSRKPYKPQKTFKYFALF